MEDVIRQAREMRASYLAELPGHGERLPVNAERLAAFISKRVGIPIKQAVVPELTAARGLLVREKDGSALILIADSPLNNTCWARFTFIKEVSHLFIETPDCFNTNAWDQARVLFDREYRATDGDAAKLYNYEVSGVVAALELLIPDEHKGAVAHMKRVEGKTNWQIASYFKVPQRHIEYRMRQWGIE